MTTGFGILFVVLAVTCFLRTREGIGLSADEASDYGISVAGAYALMALFVILAAVLFVV